MAELFGADNYLTGLAGYASSATPLLDSYASMATPAISTLPTSAMTNIAGAVAEEGADAASSALPNLMTKAGNWFTGESLPASAVGGIMNSGGVFNPATNTITDAGGNAYKLLGDGSLQGSSAIGKGLDFLGQNSKAIESGTKLVGAAGTLYSQQQAAGLAKQALADSRANTAYNRARQAQGDASLQSASDRVFGRGV